MPNEQQNWPKTVEEAVERLLVIVDKGLQERIKNLSEKDLGSLHGPFGMQVRNVFGLWGGNKELRKNCGSEKMHPDDASGIIIKAFWNRLNNRVDGDQNIRSWQELVSKAETLEEAVDWLVAIMPESTKDFIKTTERKNLLSLHVLYGKDFRRMFGLEDGNEALIIASDEEGQNPKNASRAILVALWKRLNEQEP